MKLTFVLASAVVPLAACRAPSAPPRTLQADLAELRAEFNARVGEPRFLAVLSPT